MNGNQQNQTKQDDKKKQAPQPAQEEDEFEEFNDHDWDEKMEDPRDSRIWETSWDNEDVADRFSTELKNQVGSKK